MELRELFGDGRLVILVGPDRRLLNWVAYALASETDRAFLWVDVTSKGEVRSELDILSRNLIPDERFTTVRAAELAPSNAVANLAISGVVRDDETPENLQRLLDFLRLPERSQHALSAMVVDREPKAVVLSNANRLGAYYPVEIVGPMLRAIKESGVVTIMTFADAPNEGRFAFDVIVHVDGGDPTAWRLAKFRVEKAPPGGIFRSGSELLLADVEPVAAVLRREFP